MKILNLIIKQKYFDAIMQGRKVQEFREVKPTTINKLLEQYEVAKNGKKVKYEKVDEDGNSIPIKYDAIRFFVGYNKDRDSALVEVKDAYVQVFTHTPKDENGEPMKFVADEEGNPVFFMVNPDFSYKTDADGNLIVDDGTCDDDDAHSEPLPCEDGEDGVMLENLPIWYNKGGQWWMAQQVVYNLGKILESDIKPKNKK